MHCPCNGVWLCPPCHAWVHQHPEEARHTGFILSRHIDQPWEFAFKAPLGWRLPDCNGSWKDAL